MRTLASRAPLQDAFVAIRLHTTLDASEPERRGNFSHVLASPAAMAARFPEHPEAVAETERGWPTVCGSTSAATSATAIPGAEDEEAMRKLAELCDTRLRDRYASASARRERDGARRDCRRSCGSSKR